MAVEVSNGFKSMCKTNVPSGALGRITVLEEDPENNVEITENTDIQSIEIEDDCYVNDKFIGTAVAKKVKVKLFNDDNVYDLEDKEIKVDLGFELNNTEEVVTFGDFIIEKPNTEEVQAKTDFVGYDYMIKFNKTYVDNNTYPIALGTFLSNLCTQVGVVLGSTTFVNSNYMVQGNPFTNGENCKTVLSAVAQIAGGIAKIGRDNKLYIINLSKTTNLEEIDGNNYDTFTPNKVFGPINKLIIKMNSGVDGEESVRSDAESIAQYGECAITIADNSILNSHEQRELVIDNIFNAIKGITYLPFKTTYYGYPYIDSTDKINILNVNDTENDSYIFNHTIKYDGAFEGSIETPALTKTQSMYMETRDLKSWRRNTELKVDKINGEITALVETTEEITEEIIPGMQDDIDKITDTTGTAEGKIIYIDDASNQPVIDIKLDGETVQEGTPSPSNKAEIVNIKAINKFNKDIEPCYTQATILSVLDTGIRATTTGTGTYKYGIIPIPNSDKLLGKTITMSGTITPSISGGTNMGRIALFGLNSNGTVEGSSIATLASTGYRTTTVTLPNEFPTNVVRYGLLFYSNHTATVSEGDYVDYTDVQLEEGSQAKPYRAYNCIQIKKSNQNLIKNEAASQTINGVTFTVNEDKSVTVNGTATATVSTYYLKQDIDIPAGTYTLSGCPIGGSTTTYYLGLANIGVSTPFVDTGSGHTKTISSDLTNITYRIYVKEGTTVNNLTFYPMFEKGSSKSPYVTAEEEKYYFPLEEGQKLYKGSYLADDGIHHKRNQILFDGSDDENWTINGSNQGYGIAINGIGGLNSGSQSAEAYCDYLKVTAQDNIYQGTAENVFSVRGGNISKIYVRYNSSITTVALLRQQLSSQPITVEYPLAEEEIIPYNVDQQAAWNEIEQMTTYKNITNIYSDAYAEITYVKDNGLNIYETRASANVTKKQVTELKVEEGKISSEVSNTKSLLSSNYYNKNDTDTQISAATSGLESFITSEVSSQVEQESERLAITFANMIDDGAKKVETETGYTFDKEGLKIDKSDAPTSSIIDNEAFKVKNKANNENVLVAGYVSDENSSYRGQTIVETTNLVVRNYLNIEGASRFQPYTNPVLGGHGTGVFDIG